MADKRSTLSRNYTIYQWGATTDYLTLLEAHTNYTSRNRGAYINWSMGLPELEAPVC